MAAEVRARLFPRHHQEVLVRRAARGFEIVLLLGKPQRAGVASVQLEMEVAQADDVQAERAHRHQILERRVERSGRALTTGEVEMEVVHERLVAGNRLERVAVREGQHRLPRRLAGVRARVEIHAHLLHRAGRRIVEREVLHVSRFLFALGEADADAELPFGILPVPHVAEVGVLLTREEEGVRRRERRQRAAVGLGDDQPVLRLHARQRRVDHAAELVILRMTAGVAPGDARRQVGRESLQAGVVLVGDPRFVRLGRRVHPHQIGALVDRELQVAGEDPHRQPGERHDQARAVGLHAARRGVERRVGATNVGRRPRRAQRPVGNQRVGSLPPGHGRHARRRLRPVEIAAMPLRPAFPASPASPAANPRRHTTGSW